MFYEQPFQSKEAVILISDHIQAGTASILSLIEALHDKITSIDTDDRKNMCALLQSVLNVLPSRQLDAREVTVLCEFFCSKLKDHYSIHPPVLGCLHKLSLSGHMSAKCADEIVVTLFQEVQVQACFQTVRTIVYEMLANLLDKFPAVFVKMGDDFIYNFTKNVEGLYFYHSLYLFYIKL